MSPPTSRAWLRLHHPKHSTWTRLRQVHAPLPLRLSLHDGRELHDAGRRKTNGDLSLLVLSILLPFQRRSENLRTVIVLLQHLTCSLTLFSRFGTKRWEQSLSVLAPEVQSRRTVPPSNPDAAALK